MFQAVLKSQAQAESSQAQISHSIRTSTPQPQQQQQLEDLTGPSTPLPQQSQLQQLPQSVLSGLSSTPTLPTNAPDPKFAFMDIDTSNLAALLLNITINKQLPLLISNPHLKTFIHTSIENAIQDLVHPVVDRSIKYTINACEQIIKKDYALDPDEGRMRIAAHNMMRYLVAGMAMITSRDHIYIAINTNLKANFLAQVRGASSNQQLKDSIEQACSVISNENMELACVFIQKAAVEKGIVEIDKKLTAEYDARKLAKAENRRFCDPIMLNYQNDRIPEPIRVKPAQSGGPVSQQLAVYEDFSRNIPGFIPPSDGEVPYLGQRFAGGISLPGQTNPVSGIPPSTTANTNNPGAPNPPGSGDDLLSIYDKLVTEMDSYLQGLAVSHSPASPQLVS
jgi:CCR4-NOT transcription complex subunit 1